MSNCENPPMGRVATGRIRTALCLGDGSGSLPNEGPRLVCVRQS